MRTLCVIRADRESEREPARVRGTVVERGGLGRWNERKKMEKDRQVKANESEVKEGWRMKRICPCRRTYLVL